MQVWQFAAKRSQLPNRNVLYGSLKVYQWVLSGLFQKGTKRMETAKRPAHPPIHPATNGRFNLVKPGIDAEVELFPHKRKWIRVWMK